jgi:hypothetical protein
VGAAGADGRVDDRAGRLGGQFVGAVHVAHGADGVGAAERDLVGAAALGAQAHDGLGQHGLEVVGVVGADPHGLEVEQAAEHEVALVALRAFAAEDGDHVDPGQPPGGRGQPDVVALGGARGDQHVAVLGAGVGHEVGELAGLVAAAGQARQVVALDREGAGGETQDGAEPVHVLVGRRAGGQGHRGDTGHTRQATGVRPPRGGRRGP